MVQPGNRHVKAIAEVCAGGQVHATGQRAVPKPTDRGDDVIGIHCGLFATLGDGLLDHLQRVLSQQLQDPNILPGSGFGALTVLELGPQLIEAGRQRPLGKHKGMIQSRRTATEDRQIMPRFHDPFAARVAALVTGNPPRTPDHLDPIHICLDGHRLEGPATRHTVAVRIEPYRLVLIDLRRLRDERVKRTQRQGQSGLLIPFKQLPDRLRLARHDMGPLGQSTRPQIGIQLG